MSARIDFVRACLNRSKRIVEICNEFGISEKTGYKYLRRVREGGFEALEERSHAPRNHANRITSDVAESIVAIRKKYPHYGAQTIHDLLCQGDNSRHWPAASSIGELLKRAGLIRPKRRRHMLAERSELDGKGGSRIRATEPNLVWTADFKGQFRLRRGMGEYCFPLTVLDLHTHFLLGCTALSSTAVRSAQEMFIRYFKEYGLPYVMRTDNGVPFAQPNAIGRIGKLGFWWVRLGIRPEHTTPATPSENGAHERFHRTLKAVATKPASQSIKAQQERFDRFRSEYNMHRPHRSLPERRPPGSFYVRSARPYPDRLPAMSYPETSQVRLVDTSGNIKWQNNAIFLSTNLAGEYVGITESEADLFTIAYGKLVLGDFNPDTNRFIPGVRWNG